MILQPKIISHTFLSNMSAHAAAINSLPCDIYVCLQDKLEPEQNELIEIGFWDSHVKL